MAAAPPFLFFPSSIFYLYHLAISKEDMNVRGLASSIHTCELNGANPFDYLTALQGNQNAIAAPTDTMPWNYLAVLDRRSASPAM